MIIATDLFLAHARRLLASLGCAHTPVVVTPNPIVYLNAKEVQQRAEALVPEISRSITTQGRQVGS